MRMSISKKRFYCQSDIEDNGKCTNQCDHCNEYYKPLVDMDPDATSKYSGCATVAWLVVLIIVIVVFHGIF